LEFTRLYGGKSVLLLTPYGARTPMSDRDPITCEGWVSSTNQPPRSKYRFGFKGKRHMRDSQAATTDEILESLTRQAKSMETCEKQRALGLETLVEVELKEAIQPSNLVGPPTPGQIRYSHLAKYIFATMLAAGLTFLWIYSRLSKTIDMRSLNNLQQAISRAGFADALRIELILASALLVAIIVRHSRTKVRAQPVFDYFSPVSANTILTKAKQPSFPLVER
jgi:hypothetical protein